MPSVQRIIYLIGLGLLGLSSQIPSQAACLHYEPTKVLIRGTLEQRTFPGPPNFESIEKGDAAETGYYLKPGKPVCTQARPDEKLSSYQNQRLIQLVLSHEQYQQLQPQLGQTVRLKGSLFESSTGHHHTPVLMTVLSLE